MVPGGVDHVVDEDAVAALDVTDDVAGLDLVVGPARPRLVDQGQVDAEMLAVALRHLHPPGVGRHHDDVAAEVLPHVRLEHRRRHQVVEGRVEEALDLPRVQVDADHPVGAGRREHVGHELGRDRLASGRLPVLARVAVVGADRGDALGRGALGGVDHDQVLHERVVHRAGVGLDDEDVTAADGDVVLAVDLAVGELAQVRLAQFDAEVAGDVLASVGWARPEISSRRRRGISSTPPTLVRRGAPAPAVGRGPSARRPAQPSGPRPPSAAPPRPRRPPRRRAPARCRARFARRRRWWPAVADARRHHGTLADVGVGQHAVRARSRLPAPTTQLPRRMTPGSRETSASSCDLGVDVGALGVPHGDAAAHPALVDAVAQLGLGHGQLRPVVDAGRLHGVGQHQRLHRRTRRCSGTPTASVR